MTFTTAEDNQESVEIHILQGESEMAAFNKSLGTFRLVDILPVRRGLIEIDVTFDIDANGIIHVKAEDIITGNEHEIRIEGGSNLSEKDINRMIKQAEDYANTAHQLRELADVRNYAEVLAFEIELSLNEYFTRLSEAEEAKIRELITELRHVMEGVDISKIHHCADALVEASQILA